MTAADEATIKELLDSLNDSIEDIRNHPTKTDKIPSNLEIMVRGVSDSKAIDFLFSSKLEGIISGLYEKIMNGDFESILNYSDNLQQIVDTLFGKGSFQGPISQEILNNMKRTMTSYNYQTMKSALGKTVTTMKKLKLLIKNLNKGEKKFQDKEQLQKYKDAVYAVKQVLKFSAVIYKNRRIINRKVFNGLNNIVHESYMEFDESLIDMGGLL